jgi:hypothetical protein
MEQEKQQCNPLRMTHDVYVVSTYSKIEKSLPFILNTLVFAFSIVGAAI